MKSVSRFCLESRLKELFAGHFGKVVNLGSGILDYRELIDCDEFVSVDLNKKYVPTVVASASETGLASDDFDLVVCSQLLEHVEKPIEVVVEALRLLKPGGLCIFSVPFFELFHGEEGCGDYWRFTHQGLEYLFKDFEGVRVEKVGFSSQALFNFFYRIRLLRVFNPLVSSIGFGNNIPIGFIVTAKKKEKLNL